MMGFAFGHIPLQALYVAVELGVPDLLADGEMSATELAKRNKVNEDFLRRILSYLCTLGIFEKTDQDQFKNNELSDLIRRDHPTTLAPTIRMYGTSWTWSAWGNLLKAVKEGESAFQITHQMPCFDFLGKDDEASSIFDFRMNGRPERRLKPLLENYDFSPFQHLVDVGGGQGGILFGILEKYSQLRGTLFDLKQSIEHARKLMRQRSLEKRCALVEGSFFDSVPEGGDLYLLGLIIHDWDDDRSIQILKNCRKAISQKGKVILLERVIQPRAPQPDTLMIDLEMMVMTEGGRERTETEYGLLFKKAGFSLDRVIQAQPMCILEASPQ